MIIGRPALPLITALFTLAAVAAARAQTPESALPQEPERPKISAQRWQEDWSVLRDPSLRTEPLDSLKYIPLSADPQVYLSLGADVRERLEAIDGPAFGTGHQKGNAYLLDRVQVHADLHLDDWEAFVQLEDDRAPGKLSVGPADADGLDLEEAFIAKISEVDGGLLKLRAGRQEFGFDLQRFVSDRDRPNVRQAYDAVWGDYELGDWRVISFASRPVQYRNATVFDDFSAPSLSLDGFRVERRNVGPGNLAVYYLRYQRDDARFALASGDERRNAFDAHYSGTAGPIDFDIEGMLQQGGIGDQPLLAWAFGERSGYKFKQFLWQPQLSLQVDAASGSRSATGTVGTFNPLFPNGSYFTLASLTGDANLVHVKPILSVTPAESLSLQAAFGLQWRETTQDAIYTFPVQAIAGTAGRGDAWSGAYLQLDAVKQITANIMLSVEYVHYTVGDAIRAAGGHNTDYGNIQFSFAW